MDLTELDSQLIDSMSADDMRTTLKEAYASAMIHKFNEEEQRKNDEAKKEQGKKELDDYFSAKFANLHRQLRR